MTSETGVVRSGAERAADMLQANAEFLAFVETISDSDWRLNCPGEDWTVGVVAHHVVWGHEIAAGWIRTIRAGHDVPGSPATHDAGNAAKAAEVAGISRREVIDLGHRNVEALADLLRTLTEEDFAKSAAFGPGGGMQMSLDRLAGARRHLDGHLGSIRAALGR